MELQKFIDDNQSDYLNKLKKNNLFVKKHSQLGLALIRLNKNTDYDFKENAWLRYCKGAIINLETNKLVCIPPEKSEGIIDDDSVEGVYQPLIDGTMVNMFFHRDEWIISTRSNIGGGNSWGDISFKKMFESINGTEWYNELDKGCCYSFVLQNTKNRIVTPVESDSLFLVEVYNLKDGILRLDVLPKFKNIHSIDNINHSDLEHYYCKDLYFSIKGFTLKTNTGRMNWINKNYTYVLDLKVNFNNKFMNYISLKQKDKLSEYLVYFPEDRYDFNDYDVRVMDIKDKTYENYVNVFIKKNKELKNVEYSLKPVLYEIHGMYLKDKKNITIKKVNTFIDGLDGKKLLFIEKYL